MTSAIHDAINNFFIATTSIQATAGIVKGWSRA